MLVVNYVHTSLLDIGSTYVYSSFVILLGAAHTTPVGNGPLGPSIGPAPKHTAPLGVSSLSKHTVPLGVDLARPVFLNPCLYSSRVSTPTGGSSKHTVPLGIPHL